MMFIFFGLHAKMWAILSIFMFGQSFFLYPEYKSIYSIQGWEGPGEGEQDQDVQFFFAFSGSTVAAVTIAFSKMNSSRFLTQEIFCGVLEGSFDFFGPKWHSLRSRPFQGPKKYRFSGPNPSIGPRIGFSPSNLLRPAPYKQQVHF